MLALRQELLPLATVVTPNFDETGVLIDQGPADAESAEENARELAAQLRCCVVVKGGHAKGARAIDHVAFSTASGEPAHTARLEAPWVDTGASHGTGCLFSASLCCALARGDSLLLALRHARRCMDQGLRQARVTANGGGAVWLDRVPLEPS